MDDTIKSSNSNSNFSIEKIFFPKLLGGGEAEAPQPPPGSAVPAYKDSQSNPVGRPIISGCEGPTERISSFV